MEVMYNTKGVMIMYPLAVLFGIMLILLNGYCCGVAAVLVKTNTTFRCDGRLDECLIHDDLELEFLMNPYVSRLIAKENSQHPGKNANNGNKPAIGPCKQNAPGYDACVAIFKADHRVCKKGNAYARCPQR